MRTRAPSPSAAAERGYIDENEITARDLAGAYPALPVMRRNKKAREPWKKHDKRPAVRWRRRDLTACEAKLGTGSGRPGH